MIYAPQGVGKTEYVKAAYQAYLQDDCAKRHQNQVKHSKKNQKLAEEHAKGVRDITWAQIILQLLLGMGTVIIFAFLMVPEKVEPRIQQVKDFFKNLFRRGGGGGEGPTATSGGGGVSSTSTNGSSNVSRMVAATRLVADIVKGTKMDNRFTIPATFTPIAVRSSGYRPVTGKQLAIGVALVTSALLFKGAGSKLVPRALTRIPLTVAP